MMKSTLNTFLDGLELGSVRRHRQAAILPLFSELEPKANYLTLAEAHERGEVSVRETSETGSVPELLVINRAALPVLALDGEELLGAKQNRTLNTTILLREKSETVIPVSCTEAGRWAFGAGHALPPRAEEEEAGPVGVHEMQAVAQVLEKKTRARKMESVHHSLKQSGKHKSNQGEVWESIACMEAKAGSHSPTGALNDLFQKRDRELREFVAAFPPEPGQRGLLMVVNGRVDGLDYISRPQAYALLYEKLLRSYLLDTLLDTDNTAKQDKPGKKAPAPDVPDPADLAAKFLEQVRGAKTEEFDSVGYGRDCRCESGEIAGTVLVHEGESIHGVILAREERCGESVPPFGAFHNPDLASLRRRRYRGK